MDFLNERRTITEASLVKNIWLPFFCCQLLFKSTVQLGPIYFLLRMSIVYWGHPENSMVRRFDFQDIHATIVRRAVEKNYKSIPVSTETAKKGERLLDQTFFQT